jgi:hypothetical protein
MIINVRRKGKHFIGGCKGIYKTMTGIPLLAMASATWAPPPAGTGLGSAFSMTMLQKTIKKGMPHALPFSTSNKPTIVIITENQSQ